MTRLVPWLPSSTPFCIIIISYFFSFLTFTKLCIFIIYASKRLIFDHNRRLEDNILQWELTYKVDIISFSLILHYSNKFFISKYLILYVEQGVLDFVINTQKSCEMKTTAGCWVYNEWQSMIATISITIQILGALLLVKT